MSAEVLDIQAGRHSGYSLLVITCDVDVRYRIYDENGIIRIAFPAGTVNNVSAAVLEQMKDDFFQSVDFSSAGSELVIRTGGNYELRYYHNTRPFQLVMDFTILPGKRKAQAVEPPPPVPVKEKPPVQSSPAPSPPAKTSPAPSPPVEANNPAPDSRVSFDPYELGMLLKSQGDYSGALQAFLQAVPQRNETALFQAALMYEELGQRSKAIDTMLEVIDLSPSWLEPRVKLALLYKLSGREGLAEKMWSQVLSALPVDTSVNLSQFDGQITSLEQLLQERGEDLNESIPPIDKRLLPSIPMAPVLAIVGIVVLIIAVRLLSNWRMNRMFRSVLDETGAGESELMLQGGSDEVPGAVKKPAPADYSDLFEETAPPAKPSETAPPAAAATTDEKQRMIYDLLDQNYSIAEIAKMLEMGQEEVKFIIDFRSKEET